MRSVMVGCGLGFRDRRAFDSGGSPFGDEVGGAEFFREVGHFFEGLGSIGKFPDFLVEDENEGFVFELREGKELLVTGDRRDGKDATMGIFSQVINPGAALFGIRTRIGVNHFMATEPLASERGDAVDGVRWF